MLSRILEELEEAKGPLDLNEMSRRLGVERSALDGMLRLLVRKGRLREVGPTAEACSHCAGCFSCAQGQTGYPLGKAYQLAG